MKKKQQTTVYMQSNILKKLVWCAAGLWFPGFVDKLFVIDCYSAALLSF